MWVGRSIEDIDMSDVDVIVALTANEVRLLKALVKRDKRQDKVRTLNNSSFSEKLDLALEMLGVR